jgi:hypothetical protein
VGDEAIRRVGEGKKAVTLCRPCLPLPMLPTRLLGNTLVLRAAIIVTYYTRSW